jgi:putative chitinase
MKPLTPNQLKAIYPQATAANIAKYLPCLNDTVVADTVITPLRLAAFLAQVGHESGQLRYSEEIASGAAYEGRKDLGNTERGDGVRFKGRGLIQLTGRANYAAFSRSAGVDFLKSPALLSLPLWAVTSAWWFWRTKGLNAIADRDDVRAVTKAVNGGYNGLADRTALYGRAKTILGI